MTRPDDPAPVRPAEPDAADCCGEGCAHCIFDIYDAAFERYKTELADWQARQARQASRNDVPSGD